MDFNAAIEAALPRLKRYAHRLTRNTQDAEDLLQDTVVLALCKQHLFRHGNDLRPWLFTIMHNINATNVRRAIQRATIELNEDVPVYSNDDTEISVLLHEVISEIERLPPQKHTVLVQIASGTSYDEVALREAVPLGTVRSRLSRARAQLKQTLVERIPP